MMHLEGKLLVENEKLAFLHVKGEEHRSFARQKCNYESLDFLISQIPSTVDFLQSVLLKHCVQRHVEPTVSSCPASQYVNLVPPISPLTTDKTNVPSQETAATCIKTPDPSGQEIATFKEHFAATDTDLISKRGTVTPTKQELVVDSRPQAVVIRRPVPSGMFTSPRRRPVTPSKKPWMQERSMVFSDSPIGSLQPSPCTSKETLPNFLSDSTANTLTRLATVCDKSSTGMPNHTSEGSKATKQLFSMILNQNFSTLRKKKNVTAQLGKKQIDFCQAKSGSVEQAKEINNSPLEVRMAAVDRENVELSHNEKLTAEGDKTEQGFHPEKCFSVEHEAAVEHCQIQESMMIRSKSQVNDSCGRKMTVKQKLEFGDIHNEVCSNSNKEVIISPHTNDLAVDKEKRIKDSENKSLTAEEMECAASINKKHVNLEQEREVTDCDQGIELTAKQKRENISSSHDTGSRHETGLSVEQEKECRSVIHEQIVIVEQENKVVDCNQKSMIVEQENKVADCNQEKDMTTKQKMEKLDFGHNTSMSIEQEQDATGLSAEQEIEETAVIRENIITVEEEKEVTVCSQEKDITAKLELEKFSRNASLSDEQEPKTTGLSVEQEISCIAVMHKKIMTVEQEMECTAVMHENIMTVEQEVEHKAIIHENVMTGEQEIEDTADIHENVMTIKREKEHTADIHENIVTVEQEEEVTEWSQEKDMTVRQEFENLIFNHDASKSVEQEPEVRGCNEFVIVKQDMEKLGSSCDRPGTDEREMEVTVSGQGTVVAVEQRKEVIGFQHEHIVIEQEAMEVMGSSPDNDIAIEQEQEVTSFSHEKTVIIEKDREVMRFSHDNGETFEPAKGVTNFSHDNSITAEQEREVTNFSHNNSITAEQDMEMIGFSHDNGVTFEPAKGVTNFSYDNSITAEQEREVTNFSCDNSITVEQKEVIGFSDDSSVTIEQAKEVTSFSPDNSITVEQAKEVTSFSHDNSITVEQAKEVTSLSHDNSITVEQAKEVTSLSHDNSITVEQAKEVTSFSHDNSITVEQAKEVTSFSHDNSITVEQAKEVTSFSHDNSINVEQAKEVTSLGHGNSITIEQAKEVTSFSPDNSITVEQAKEVTSFSPDNSITVEQAKEVTSFSHDNSITVEQAKEVTSLSHDNSITVEQAKEVTSLSHDNSITVEQAKEVTSFSHDNSITVEQAKEVTSFSHDNSITVEQAKEVTSFSHDNSINVEQAKEVTSLGHGNSITIEQAKEVTRFSHDNTITVEQGKEVTSLSHGNSNMTEMTEPSPDDSVTIEGEGYYNDRIMTVGNVFCVPEINCWESMSVQEKEISKKCTAVEQIMEQPSHKEIVTFEEEKIGSNFNKEKCKTFVGKEENKRNDRNHVEIITYEQAYPNNDKNINIEQEVEEIISDQDKKSSCVLFENEETDSVHDKVRRDEEEIKEKGTNHAKITTIDGKTEPSSNQMQMEDVEEGKAENNSNYEKMMAVEEKKEFISDQEQMENVEEGKESSLNHDKQVAVFEQDKAMMGFRNVFIEQKVVTNAIREKRKVAGQENEEMNFNLGKSVLTENVITVTKFHSDVNISDQEKCEAIENKKKKRSDLKRRLTDEQEIGVKGSSHEKMGALENKKEKVCNHEEDKSIEKRKERKQSKERGKSVEETATSGSTCKEEMTVDKKKERKRSNHEKHAAVEENKRHIDPKKDECVAIETNQVKTGSDHVKALIDDHRNNTKRPSHGKSISIDEKKQTTISNCGKEKSVERRKKRESSNHEKHLSVEEKKDKGSNHDENMDAEFKKEKTCFHHEKVLADEQRGQKKGSNNEEDKSVEGRDQRKSSNHRKSAPVEETVIKESSYKADAAVEKRKERNRSNHEKHASAEETNKRNRSNHEKHSSTEETKERNRSNHEKQASDEGMKERNRSNHEKHASAEEMKERNRPNHEKHSSPEETKEKNRSNHGKHASAEEMKERNRSNHEKHASAEEMKERNSHEKHATAEVIKERNRSNHEKQASPEDTKEKNGSNHEKHASADEMKERNRSNHEKHVSAEVIKERNRSNHEKHSSPEDTKEKNGSNHEKHASADEMKERNRSNHEKHASAEVIKERNRPNHEKHSSPEETKEKNRSNHGKHASAEEMKERNRSNHEKHASAEEMKERNSHEKHASAEVIKERNRSNHEKHASADEMKERNRSNHETHASAEEMKERNSHEKHASAEVITERNRSNHEKHMSPEEMKERNRSNHEKHASAEEMKERNRSNHEKHSSPEETKEKNRSKHEKHASAEEVKERNRSNHEKHASAEEMKERNRSNHQKHVCAEEMKEKNRSDHQRHVSAEEMKERNRSNHQKHASAEETKEKNRSNQKKNRSNHEKHLSTEEMKSHLDSKHNERKAVENKMKKDSSDHGKRLIYEPRTRNNDSSREKYVAVEEKKKIKVSDRVEKCVQRKQDGQSSSHDDSLSVEKNKKKDFSPQDGKPVEKNNAQKRSRYEKYLAEEGKKNNKHSNQVSMAVEKDKKYSLHEKRMTDKQRSQQNGSKHEEDETVEKWKERKRSSDEKCASAEKRKERKRSSHEKYASAEEIKNNMDFKYDESMDVENKNEKESFHRESKFVDEPRDKDKCSNHEKKMAVEDEEKTKTKVFNHKEDKSVERNKDMKNINHEKHSAYEEKRGNNEHMAIENMEKESSHCKKALIDDQRQQKNSKREDKSVEKRKENKSSNHVEEKEMKSSTCEEYMAGKKGRKRQRSDYKKYQDCKHNAGMSVACKEKDSCHDKRQRGEQGNRRKSSSCETNIATKDTKEAKVSNQGEDRSVERRQERKPSKHERSLSLEGKEVRDSNCKEGLSVEKKRERKSSNSGKHLATEGKKSNEEYSAVESKKETKSHHEKEMAGEQRIQPKGYNQQEDKRKDRKRSDETHAAAEEFKSHLKFKHHEHLAVECGNEKEKSNHDKRLIDEPRNRTSSSREKHTAVEENKTKVSSHDKDKSVERKKDRKLSNHERSVSVEKREITASNCKEDMVTEKRKERKRSKHEKHETVEEKKTIKGSESGESMAVDKITKKSSDQEKSSKAEEEKNIKDFDNNKSSDIRQETAHRDMNPVVRICGRELGQCIVSDSLAETVYKHLAGRSLSTGASNLIYVASHKVSINNLLLKGGQIPGQTSQGIDSSSAHASADTACKSVLKSKSGQSCPHKHEDRSGQKTGCKVCKDVDGVCVEKAVKSTTESKSTNVDKTVNADVGLSEETDRMTCDSAIGHPSNINRKSSPKEKPGKCKTKTRKSYRKEGSDLHGDLQEHLEKQGKPFKADKKAGNAEKYVETDRQLGFQGTGQVIGGVDEVNSRQSNAEFQIPSMKQSSEVVKSVSKPAEKLNEVVCNSKDSYMDEDTVDIDFYESYNLDRQSNIVNTDGLNDVHTSFPYISDRAALPHSSESTTLPITTKPIPPHTRQSKTENVVRTCNSSPSDCKLTHDQNVQQPRSSTDADKHVRGNEVDTYTEYGTNCSYKNSASRSSRRNKQIYSDGRLQLSIRQRNVSKGKCVQEENISTDKEMMGQLSGDKFSEESARGMHAVSDEVSTSTITSSSVVVPEQSEHPLRTGSLFEEDDDTDSLLSSENMKTVKRNSDDGGDFIELMGQFGSVVVPNIAERVKSRSRLACGAPSSAVDKGVQRSDEEKKARKRRKKELREKHRQNLLDGINSQQVEQLSDTSGKWAARNVMSNSGDKRCKNTRTRKSTPALIVPNIAESVKNRRSCTMFNHLGQYADSGEGSDTEDENIQVKPRSAEKCRQRKYYSSRERNLKALSSNSGTEYDKNGLVKHSRVLYCQRKSNVVKVGSSVDFLPEMEIDSKTSSLSGCPSKAEDEPNDLSSAVVVRRKKSNVYPSNKRPEVDWGKVQPSDGSSEPDPVENSLLRETLIVAERNKTHAQSDLILKSSQHGWSHSTTGSQASPTELIPEAKVVLVDIITSPNANIHTKATSGHHSNIHGGTPTSPYHANVQIKTSSSPYAKVHTNSPTIHYPTDIHIKTSTSPYHAKFHTHSPTIHYPTDIHVKTSISPYHTNINIKTPTRHYRTDSGDPVMHRSRHRKAKQAETSSQPLCSKFPHSVRNISDVPSSPGISCSPRLRLKIRRRSGNKGFSSTLEEIHDCLPANLIGCSSHVDTEHCSESCECPNRFEDKYSSRIDNLSTEPLTKQDIGRSSLGLLPQAQYGELSQSVSDVTKSSKRTREPSASYSSDSESTLEYPLSFEAVNKRIKLSPGHCANPDVCDNYNADNQRNEVSPSTTALDTSANTYLPRDPIWGHSSNKFRSSSPCFSSPVTKSHFKCFTTPKKSDAADRPIAGSASPVFNLSMKQLRHAQSSHSSASAHGLSGDSDPQTGMTYLALQNAGLQASVILDSSMTMKRTPGRHLSSKRSLSPPDLNLPSAKKTKVEASRHAAADRHSVQLERRQETIPLESFTESSNHGFHSLFQAAPKFNPAADFKHTVNHVLPSHSASTSQHGLTSVPPYAEAPHLDLKSFDGTEWVTCTTTDRNMKPASPRESDEDTVMLLEIDRFSGVSDLGFEDLLSQVHTFSSPEKATDTSWGDICDTYLSTSFNNHHTHNVGQPGLGQSPAGRGAKVVSFSPCRKQFKNCSSPLRKGPPEESVKGQTGCGYHGHVIKEKTTMGPERTVSKNQANCSGLNTTVEQELRTPVKNADIEDLKLSPYIQKVDEVISFNFMSPQKIKFSPHQTYSSSTKVPLSPQTEHRRSQNASHSRRLFSPAKMSPQRVNSSPCHVHKSTVQSLLSPPEHQKSHTTSHSKRLFSPHSPQSVYVSPHHAHRSTLQSQLSPQAEHRRPHTASHSKRLFSPHSPQSAYCSPQHRSTLQSLLNPQAEQQRPHTTSHSKRLFSPAKNIAADEVS